jgi:hypothetical protein
MARRPNATPRLFTERTPAEIDALLFIGLYPCGISYADRTKEQHGDYKKLAFLPYSSLVLEVEKDCPKDVLKQIESHADTIIARRGQQFQISACGQTVLLGGK